MTVLNLGLRTAQHTTLDVALPAGDPAAIVPAIASPVDACSGRPAGDRAAAPAVHALLIGIDDYVAGEGHAGTNYRPLRGCVRDILEVERFLRDAGVAAHRITTLISPGADGPAPTYDAIVAAWQRVTRTAAPGDVVYIHYSGHGGRSASLFPAWKPNGLDESLAPCDVNLATGRFLRDVELAVLLRRMVERGLWTTLVLDSCYAGSATRANDVQARRGDADDLAPRAGQSAQTSAVAPRAELEAMAQQLALTPRGDDESWRIAPAAQATVIAACRPHEAAFEYAVDGVRRGALTYFWLDTLRQRGAAMTHRAAYRQTFARVQAAFPEQSPVLIGPSERQVLGTEIVAEPVSIAILEVHGDQVTLAAGDAGLVAIGTRLAVVPGELAAELVDLAAMPLIEVTSVQAARCHARVVDPSTGGPPIALGSQAVVIAEAPAMCREVRWLASPSPTPAELAARAELERAIAADPSHAIRLATGAAAHYQVAIDDARFVILDGAGRPLPDLRPAIAITDPAAARAVVARLVHVARYHNVRELTNTDPRSPLAGTLELSLYLAGEPDPRAALPACPTLPCGAELRLRIRNRSPRVLSLAIFSLSADWAIDHVNEGAPISLEPGTFVELGVTTSLPDGYDAATDILKVIGTLDQAELGWLTLAPLDRPEPPRPLTRGPRNHLEALAELMYDPARATRRVAAAVPPTLGWTEAQIAIATRR